MRLRYINYCRQSRLVPLRVSPRLILKSLKGISVSHEQLRGGSRRRTNAFIREKKNCPTGIYMHAQTHEHYSEASRRTERQTDTDWQTDSQAGKDDWPINWLTHSLTYSPHSFTETEKRQIGRQVHSQTDRQKADWKRRGQKEREGGDTFREIIKAALMLSSWSPEGFCGRKASDAFRGVVFIVARGTQGSSTQ